MLVCVFEISGSLREMTVRTSFFLHDHHSAHLLYKRGGVGVESPKLLLTTDDGVAL